MLTIASGRNGTSIAVLGRAANVLLVAGNSDIAVRTTRCVVNGTSFRCIPAAGYARQLVPHGRLALVDGPVELGGPPADTFVTARPGAPAGSGCMVVVHGVSVGPAGMISG